MLLSGIAPGLIWSSGVSVRLLGSHIAAKDLLFIKSLSHWMVLLEDELAELFKESGQAVVPAT